MQRTGRSFLASGGWLVIAAVAFAAAVFVVHAARLLSVRQRPTGDGSHVESYGFSLSPLLVVRDLLVASGMPKDGLAALVEPAVWSTAEADAAGRGRSKVLVASDLVIGLEIAGQARAYPLRILVWHEIVNDTLAGVPVLVTYNPLCDSAVVCRRVVNGRPVSFGVSGLLYNSNLVMYDRESPDASLWSQLQFRAIAGPAAAAGLALDVLPMTVTTWDEWRRLQPGTTVLAPDPRMAEQYRRDPYTSYFGSDELRFPVSPAPDRRLPNKTPVVAVRVEDAWHAFPFPVIVERSGAAGRWHARVGATELVFVVRRDHPAVVTVATTHGQILPTVYAFWFAWGALQGWDTLAAN
jgi:hypothetical protein